jgi:hypothetical protein
MKEYWHQHGHRIVLSIMLLLYLLVYGPRIPVPLEPMLLRIW